MRREMSHAGAAMAEPNTTDEKARDFAELVCSIVRVPNPQRLVAGQPGETKLAQFVCRWLAEHKIAHEWDPSWGVHAVLTGPDGPGAPGCLLAAHMDSDHLDTKDLANVHVKGRTLVCPGLVGLDCKTGVAIALSVLERLQSAPALGDKTAWQVHCLFTVGEESGQKGAIRAPIGRLLAGRVRFGFVIDRMTSGSKCPRGGPSNAPQRHVVTMYKNVPLLDESEGSSGARLLEHLNAAWKTSEPQKAFTAALPRIESPNCADAIELRGRFLAEVIGPSIAHKSVALEAALEAYRAATAAVMAAMASCDADERVSSMNAPPRYTRYQAMRQVHDALHDDAQPLAYDPSLAFSVVNLSYDYDDGWDTCDLGELDVTADILRRACRNCCADARRAS